jgi:hypothetical protein
MAYAAALAARVCIPAGYGNDLMIFVCPGPETDTSFGAGLNGESPITVPADSFTGETKLEAQQIASNFGCSLLDCRFGNEEQEVACEALPDPPVGEDGYLVNQPVTIIKNTYFAADQEGANAIAKALAAATRVCIPASLIEQYIEEIDINVDCLWEFFGNSGLILEIVFPLNYTGSANSHIAPTRNSNGVITGTTSTTTAGSGIRITDGTGKLSSCGGTYRAVWFCENGEPLQKFVAAS